MARGHSARHGRSRCTSKRGPRARAHRSRSVVLREAERKAKGGRSESDPFALMPDDTFMPSAPTLAGDRRRS